MNPTTEPMLAPFSDEELAELEQIMFSDGYPDDGMTIEAADGLMCALALAAARIDPSDFLPLMFGGKLPEFADKAVGEKFFHLLLRRWIDINNQFWGDSEYAYTPILMEVGDDASWTAELQQEWEASYGAGWAEGFAAGVEFLAADYETAGDNNEGIEDLLLAIFSLAHGKDLRSDNPDESPLRIDQRKAIVDSLTVQLQAAAEYFAEHPSSWRKQPIRVEKIGRNDPCTCGSGKKYKKCCGA
ncbi:MAG: UPF0149 family protein [Permianibacter sp.]